MSETEDPAEEKRKEYMAARRAYSEALRIRDESLRLNPHMRDGKDSSRSTLGDRIKRNTMDLVEAKSVYDMGKNLFGNGNDGAKSVRADPVGVTGAIIQELVRQRKTTEEIDATIGKINPYIQTLALAQDNPTVQNILISKILGGTISNNPNHDAIELLRLYHEMRGPEQKQASDPAAMMNAGVNAVRTGIELGKTKNGGIDPMLQMMQENHKQALDMQERHFEQIQALRSQQPTFAEQMEELGRLQGTFGKLNGKESENVQLKRLEMDAARLQREHESSLEIAKEKRQAAMLTGISGAIGKALESPILREAGRKMAETLPGPLGKAAGTVSQVQSQAARSVLDQPLEEALGFTCETCGASARFTRRDLKMIEATPTRTWACPKCGASYTLKGGTTSNNSPGKDDRVDVH